MSLISKIVRRLGGSEMPKIKVRKPNPLAESLASTLAHPVSLSAETQASTKAISERMGAMTEPHPGQRYKSIAASFAGASSAPWKLALLELLVQRQRAKSILEIGTAYGVSAVAFANAQRGIGLPVDVTTIEFMEPQASLGPANIHRFFPIGVDVVIEDKNTALPRLAGNKNFDLVFHDGGHAGDQYVEEFDLLAKAMPSGGLFVIDDIRWDDSEDNRARTVANSKRTCWEGWQEILQKPQVGGAIEYSGSVGLVFIA